MKMKDLLNKRSSWAQGTAARTVDNKPCKVDSPQATKFCLLGAFQKCYGQYWSAKAVDHFSKYRALCAKTGGIASWNDDPNRTFGEVKRLLEELDI